jgi:hypothetical protein
LRAKIAGNVVVYSLHSGLTLTDWILNNDPLVDCAWRSARENLPGQGISRWVCGHPLHMHIAARLAIWHWEHFRILQTNIGRSETRKFLEYQVDRRVDFHISRLKPRLRQESQKVVTL